MATILLILGLWYGAANQCAPELMTVEYTIVTRDIPFTDNLVVDQIDDIKVYLAND